MSIKSLLQLILFLLIILIIGGIYYLYFYSDTKQANLITIEDKSIINENLKKKNLSEDGILEDRELINNQDLNVNKEIKEDKKKIIDKNIDQKKSETESLNNDSEVSKKNNKNDSLKDIKNLTKEIEYITTNRNNDVFKIFAKYGKTNLEDTNILDLEQVKGTFSSKDRSDIQISSDNASYNYNNQDSNFYSNVIIKYDNRIITCDNLDLIINDNIAIAYNNVVVKDEKSIMKAQMITLNTLDKSISINSKDKIKIFSN